MENSVPFDNILIGEIQIISILQDGFKSVVRIHTRFPKVVFTHENCTSQKCSLLNVLLS